MNSIRERHDNTRCSACVMPTSPAGGAVNEAGECFWCQSNFPNYTTKGEERLREIIERSKSDAGAADCLVGLSGGKDSSFVVMEMKRKYGLRVEAFTYVHGGLTDFALDNARKVARVLDVKHHIVSLPDDKHLKLFKAYFEAWIASEDPVAAAMTCVACKHLHYLGTRLAAERKIPLMVWAESPLETPPFLPTQSNHEQRAQPKGIVHLSTLLAGNIIRHRRFRRAFLGDIATNAIGCLSFRPEGAFLGRRFPGVKHVQYFDYCDWNGTDMVAELKESADWSVPGTVVSDWHSDCRFNVFKEYMFQKMLGASYTDAFLSNQVRHGLITRAEAWEKLVKSKTFFASELSRVLPELGLEHLASHCDISCFEI